MIEAFGISKIVKSGTIDQKILDNVNLKVESKEFVAIIGRSGAGKSSLLYAFSLLDSDFSGRISIDGKTITELSDHNRVGYRLNNFGFIFQEYALLPELTATENVALPFLMQGVSRAKAFARSRETLAQLGLEKKFNSLPAKLSGGEQQRVAIARAIAGNPKILFADEPTANLDSQRACEILAIFLKLNLAGQTIIMVTHEDDYAKMTHRVVEMKDGRIITDKRIENPKVNLCAKFNIV